MLNRPGVASLRKIALKYTLRRGQSLVDRLFDTWAADAEFGAQVCVRPRLLAERCAHEPERRRSAARTRLQSKSARRCVRAAAGQALRVAVNVRVAAESAARRQGEGARPRRPPAGGGTLRRSRVLSASSAANKLPRCRRAQQGTAWPASTRTSTRPSRQELLARPTALAEPTSPTCARM
jgi:hypothetical protein